MFEFGRMLYDRAGLNKSILINILTRLIQSAAGILALLLITQFLNKNEQGYYYTFTSFLAIQVFFELGVTGIITQYVAHEAAHLSWFDKHQLSGNSYYQSRLASILHLSVKWFLLLSVILFLVLYYSGKLFFSTYNSSLHVNWEFPWLILSASTAIFLLVNLSLAILEGLGKIEEINKLKLLQQSLNIVFLVLFFSANLKLLSAGLAFLISNVIIGFIILLQYRKIFFNLWSTEVKWRIDFRKEILPYLLRIGLGNISGYFILQIINPVLFATQGPVIAGQMGATQTFLNGILVVSLSWFNTKVSLFSNFVSRKKFRSLNLIYRKNLVISLVVCSLGLIFFVFFIWGLKNYFPKMGNRFLDITPLIFLGLTQLASLIGQSQAYYLRSFKQEPFFITSLVIGIISGISTVICCKYFDITKMTFFYFIINGVVALIWVCIIFRRKTFEWTNSRLNI